MSARSRPNSNTTASISARICSRVPGVSHASFDYLQTGASIHILNAIKRWPSVKVPRAPFHSISASPSIRRTAGPCQQRLSGLGAASRHGPRMPGSNRPAMRRFTCTKTGVAAYTTALAANCDPTRPVPLKSSDYVTDAGMPPRLNSDSGSVF